MNTIRFLYPGIAVLLFIYLSQWNSAVSYSKYCDYQDDNDTTIYNQPDHTAELQDAINYFLANNKYKDWKDAERKMVYIQGIVEKNGTVTGVKVIKSSQIEDLDKEAVRLIKAAKYSPGKHNNKYVRSKFAIAVSFPPQKQ